MGARRHLPENHTWRTSKLFNGQTEHRSKPLELSGDQILEQIDSGTYKPYGKHPQNRKRQRNEHQNLNWSKRSIMFDLPYWKTLKLRHNLDVMHIEKNICDNVVGTLLSVDGKNKDTDKARLDLEDMKIRKELHLKRRSNGSFEKPPALFTLSVKEREGFCDFLKSIKYPDGYAANISNCVNAQAGKLSGLKSHDSHVLIQRLLPIGMRGYLNKEIGTTLFELGNFFKQLCSKTLRRSDLHKLDEQIVLILCKLEMLFPPAFFDVMVHLAIHLPREAMLGGPVQYRWMYPIERLLGRLKGFVANKAHPEGSIAEAYISKECTTFCSMYLDGVETLFNRPERNYDMGDHGPGLTVFTQTMNELWSQVSPEATDDMWSLANGPSGLVNTYSGCICNGVRYHTIDRDNRRKSQNSGLVIEGEHQGQLIHFYGHLCRVWELNYLFRRRIVLFQCEWLNTGSSRTMHVEPHFTIVDVTSRWYKDDSFILPSQVEQVFYVNDTKLGTNWRVVEKFQHRGIWDVPEMDVVQPDDAFQQEKTTEVVPAMAIDDDVVLRRHDIESEIIPMEVLQSVRGVEAKGVTDDAFICDDEDGLMREGDDTDEEYDLQSDFDTDVDVQS
ncbi:uncharacterized protein LOC114269797 [Camellia sinensis]|uniref:uncharacterized protein LOC114269797 n=1 Tax=Camellia sinensis TaxID=4442 RepID=UPI0010367B45|nr:uncharacterized protein LOC114269797 [Camellia sinensis]